MFTSSTIWLAIFTSAHLAHGYADFGTVTAPCNFEPIFDIPRPKFVPEDAYMRYEPFSSSITAVAPSLRLGRNGTHKTSWSLHFVEAPTHTTQMIDHGLRRRGVFSGDPPIATCRPCDKNGNPIGNSSGDNSTNTSGAPYCSVTDYDGVFRDGAPSTSSPPEYCFNSGYTGPLVPTPIPTEAGLPCCPVCYPISTNGTNGTNTSFTASTGVFSPTITFPGTPGTIPIPTLGSNGGKETVTVTATATQPVTITQITLSIETITPTGVLGSPVVTTGLNTIIGCGTASGCGTVIGSGTVYLAPLGFPAVTSSGTVSGCAPTLIGCGTMIATSGIFTAPTSGPPATITACGSGTGSATLIGSGTVWPAGFNDMISFVSSGTITGSGRVKGCGTITGYGTFTISEPYTGTGSVTTTNGAGGGVETTVNVYVSYCPGDLEQDPMGAGMRLAGNFSGDDTIDDGTSLVNPHTDDPSDPNPDPDTNRYLLSAISPTASNHTSLNSTITANSTSLNNTLCHICPQDSGICCPPSIDCGGDGHCPWTALELCGYALHGVNIVDMRNSSSTQGMSGGTDGTVAGKLKAPLGSDVGGSGDGNGGMSDGGSGNNDEDDNDETRNDMDIPSMQKERRFKGQTKHKFEPRHEHPHEHGLAHRFALAHFHGR